MSSTLERDPAAASEPHDLTRLRPGTTRFLVATACRHGAHPRRVEMPIEEYEEGERRLVRAYLPEADPDRDIMVSLRGRELWLRCHRRFEMHACDSSAPHDVTFDIVLSVPVGTTPTDVGADYGDGVLLVSIPRAVASRRETLPVTQHGLPVE